MDAMLIVIILGALSVAAFAAVGHLQRIADAIEAQNRAYGIADAEAAATPEEVA